jgi:sec-independent protein translocase protein TatB
MFDIGFSELVLIAVLALLVLGPKRLPEAARLVGRTLGRVRRFLTDARRDFDRELNTAEMDELRQLKQELTETRLMMEESSGELYRRVTQEPDSAAAAPPAADGEPKSVTPKRRTRKSSTSKKNGRTGRTRSD